MNLFSFCTLCCAVRNVKSQLTTKDWIFLMRARYKTNKWTLVKIWTREKKKKKEEKKEIGLFLLKCKLHLIRIVYQVLSSPVIHSKITVIAKQMTYFLSYGLILKSILQIWLITSLVWLHRHPSSFVGLFSLLRFKFILYDCFRINSKPQKLYQ